MTLQSSTTGAETRMGAWKTEPRKAAPTTTETRSALEHETIAGTEEQAARKVQAVSPEGRPAHGDAKSGPRKLLREIVIIPVVLLVGAVVLGVWVNVVVGLAVFALGALALLVNPVVAAAAMRVEDRAKVTDEEQE